MHSEHASIPQICPCSLMPFKLHLSVSQPHNQPTTNHQAISPPFVPRLKYSATQLPKFLFPKPQPNTPHLHITIMPPQPIDPLRMRIFSELNLHLAPHNVAKESMQIASSTSLSLHLPSNYVPFPCRQSLYFVQTARDANTPQSTSHS
jgi:hypothetical protein